MHIYIYIFTRRPNPVPLFLGPCCGRSPTQALRIRAAPGPIAPSAIAASDDGQQQGLVEDAARKAAIHDEIEGLENGYQTLLGERGVNLSGGQRQRIAIARALMGSPQILLLDDVLSAVDTATEARILQAFKEARRGRMAVVISHRISTVQSADQLIVLDAGRAVESGSHDELMAQGGVYAQMHRLQSIDNRDVQGEEL